MTRPPSHPRTGPSAPLRHLLSRSLLLSFLLLCTFFSHPSSALPLPLLHTRQDGTSGSDTDSSSGANGGAQSANSAAHAAGDSINTGSGGDRSTPNTQGDFARLLSGTFFGCLLCLFFGGAFVVQAWSYFETYGRKGGDRVALQVLMGLLLFCSLLSDAVLIHRIFDVHVTNFGNFAFPLLTIGWELTVDYICIALMATSVQLYFAHRVWSAFGRSLLISIPFGFLITFTFVGGITSGALSLRSGSAANVRGSALQSFQPDSTPWRFSVVFATWLIGMAVTDVGLCALLVLQLSKMKSPFFNTRHAVARLLTLSIETCFTTVGFSLSAMILFLTIPQNFFYLIPLAPIGQLYACSVSATLMARPSIAKELAAENVPAKGAESRAVEEYARGAPNSLAKPVLKRIMKREEKRFRAANGGAAAGEPLRVQMVTTVQQVRSRDDPNAGEVDLGPGAGEEKEKGAERDPRLEDDTFMGGLGLALTRTGTRQDEKARPSLSRRGSGAPAFPTSDSAPGAGGGARPRAGTLGEKARAGAGRYVDSDATLHEDKSGEASPSARKASSSSSSSSSSSFTSAPAQALPLPSPAPLAIRKRSQSQSQPQGRARSGTTSQPGSQTQSQPQPEVEMGLTHPYAQVQPEWDWEPEWSGVAGAGPAAGAGQVSPKTPVEAPWGGGAAGSASEGEAGGATTPMRIGDVRERMRVAWREGVNTGEGAAL